MVTQQRGREIEVEAADAAAQKRTWNALANCFHQLGTTRKVAAHQSLLRPGDVARHLYLIERGAARLFVLSPQGAETSIQFFFEGEVVSSLESLATGEPSSLGLVSMEPCTLKVVERTALMSRIEQDPALRLSLMSLAQERLIHYIKLYTCAIASTPTQRYVELQATHNDTLERIPLNSLAGYLGVSAVHLSRIRRKLKMSARRIAEPL